MEKKDNLADRISKGLAFLADAMCSAVNGNFDDSIGHINDCMDELNMARIIASDAGSDFTESVNK